MYAVEFETDIKGKYIEIPEYDSFKNQHVRVIILKDTSPSLNVENSKLTIEKNELLEEFKQLKQKATELAPKVPVDIDITSLTDGMNDALY